MTQPDKLKPCPFCGDADIRWNNDCSVFCCNCKAEIQASTHNEAVNLWNTRTPDLSRILKLAVCANAFLGPNGNSKRFSELVNANEALTPEDIQLLESVLKE